MDNKRLIIAMLLTTGLVLGWIQLSQLLSPRPDAANRGQPAPTTQPAQQAAGAADPAGTGPTTNPGEAANPGVTQNPGASETTGTTVGAETPSGSPAAPAGTAATSPAVQPTAQPGSTATATGLSAPVIQATLSPRAPAGPTQSVLLGSRALEDPQFALGVMINPQSAGIDQVIVNGWRMTKELPEPYHYQTPLPAAPGVRVLGTATLTADRRPIPLADATWTLVNSSADSATFELLMDGPDGQALRLTKTFLLRPRTHESQGFELAVTQSITNISSQTIDVAATINGPLPAPAELEGQPERFLIHAHLPNAPVLEVTDLVAHQVDLAHFPGGKPTLEMVGAKPEDGDLMWTGIMGAYFHALLRPDPLPGSDRVTAAPPQWIASARATDLTPDIDYNDRKQVITALTSKAYRLSPGQTLTLPMRAYFGPKKRGILDSAYYADLPFAYDNTLVLKGIWCTAICTSQWLIAILVKLLQAFHFVVRDWGLAIIGLVLLVRGLLHPITKRAQINMMKMSKLGPEIERLKKKYGDDKEGLNRAMVDVYKQQGAGPILGCLPMFLQMPIWIALYATLQSTFELRQAPFFYGLTWIDDLAKPDNLIDFGWSFDLFFIKVSGLHLLPFLLGVVFFFQQKLTPKPPATTPEQEMQQKMMQWMTLIFPVFLYSLPSGLNLYILTSTAIGIIESKIVRDHIKKQEELEKNKPVVVDANVKPNTKGGSSAAGPAPKKSGLMAKLAELQEMAEQVKREADKKKR